MAKRSRDEAYSCGNGAKEDDPALALRRLALSAHPSFARGARSCIRIALVPQRSLSTIAGVRGGVLVHPDGTEAPSVASFAPTFTHQAFPLEQLFGYRGDVALRVWLADPSLEAAVTGEAPGGSLPRDGAAVAVPPRDGGAPLSVRVPPDDVIACLRPALPVGFPADALAARIGGGGGAPPLPLVFFPPLPPPDTWMPPGDAVLTYATDAASCFVMHSWVPASSPPLVSYSQRLVTLAMWAIETASAVDFSDDRWRVFATYAVTGGNSFSLVAFATIYRFSNPLRTHRPDTLRVAQVVVLPRFQRGGHGEKLLVAIHAHAACGGGGGEEEDGVLEVGVESPCEGMTRLRDAFDVRRAWEGRVFAHLPGWGDDACGVGGTEATSGGSVGHTIRLHGAAALSLVVGLSTTDAARVQDALRITIAQVRRVHLALLLARLDVPEVGGGAEGGGGAAAAEGVAALSTAFRLLYKRTVYDADADVRALKDPVVRKRALEDAYLEGLAGLTAVLSRIRSGAGGGARLCTVKAAEAAAAAWDVRATELDEEGEEAGAETA